MLFCAFGVLWLLFNIEDYRINAGGNYKLMEDEDGVLRPVTRRKNLILDNLGKINKE